MTIELDDKSYIVGVWFSSNPVNNNNWMGCVIHDPEKPGCFKGWSRFRYTRDNKIFDSDDEKSWMTFYSQPGQTLDAVIGFMEECQLVIEPRYPKKDCLIVNGNLKKFISLLGKKDWFNMKQLKA